jgi:hypothetical protein
MQGQRRGRTRPTPRDTLHLQIQDLLDRYRRDGLSEEDVRHALEQAWRGSVTISRASALMGSTQRR